MAAARRYEFNAGTLFAASMIFGAAAAAAGLIKVIDIPTEVISPFDAIATGSTSLSNEAQFRLKAKWFYTVRDAAKSLIFKLNYEMPLEITADDIAGISSEWRDRRAELGREIAVIQDAREKKTEESLTN